MAPIQHTAQPIASNLPAGLLLPISNKAPRWVERVIRGCQWVTPGLSTVSQMACARQPPSPPCFVGTIRNWKEYYGLFAGGWMNSCFIALLFKVQNHKALPEPSPLGIGTLMMWPLFHLVLFTVSFAAHTPFHRSKLGQVFDSLTASLQSVW